MAERKQVNRYYPPDFDPAKHKSINKYRNSHPLRERAKKLSQGILVIRFEMPYNIWCGGCGNHVGMGVRYNAEKKKVGKYYTTPIYRFRMKCHLCDNYIEMETDPKNFDYTIISGARRKNQKWDMAENEQVLTEDREAVKKLARDAMYKLEHGVDDSKKLKKAAPSLSQIAEIQSAKKDDYSQNQILRKKFREKKKELLADEASDKALLAKSSLDIDLVPENEDDKKLASLLRFSTTQSYEETRQQKRSEIQNRDIFALPSTSTLSSSDTTPSSSSSSSSASPSDKTPSKITPALKHSEAHRTLMTQVLKRKGPGVFGAFSSTSSSSQSSPSSNHTPKRILIGGAKGFIVTKKRKQSCDSVDREVKKRAKSLISENQELNSKPTPPLVPDKNSDSNKDEDDECEVTLSSTLSSSISSSAITACSTCSISTPASETEQTRTPENVECLHCKGELSCDGKCLHGQVDDCEKASGANNSDKCNNDKTLDVTNLTTDSVSSESDCEPGQTTVNKSSEQKTENASPSILQSGAFKETQETKKELNSLSLVSCYSSSSESEGEL